MFYSFVSVRFQRGERFLFEKLERLQRTNRTFTKQERLLIFFFYQDVRKVRPQEEETVLVVENLMRQFLESCWSQRRQKSKRNDRMVCQKKKL